VIDKAPSGGKAEHLMAYDERLADLLRAELSGAPSVTEVKMFGGLCLMSRGNMVCGVHRGGGMFRVGKDREAEALAIAGARPMTFTGRPMPGMVECEAELLGDEERRGALAALALAHASVLPEKVAKSKKPR
jgi:TfoX/Sxy family transcriptional regulator of competence genes